MRISIYCVLLVLIRTTAVAQESSFQFSLGYGFPAGSQKIAENMVTTGTTITGTTTTRTGVYGSLGSGFNLTASYRRMFSDHVGIDFAFGYIDGSAIKTSAKPTSISPDINGEFSTYANSFSFDPTLVLTAGTGSLKPYARIGFSFARITMKNEAKYTLFFPTSSQTNESKDEYTGEVNIGFKGGAGLMFGAGSRVRLYTEIMVTSMTFYPSKGEVILYWVDGKDRLSTLTTAQRYVDFKTEITTSSSNPPPSDKPSQAMQFDVPMSNLQINLGCYIKLGK